MVYLAKSNRLTDKVKDALITSYINLAIFIEKDKREEFIKINEFIQKQDLNNKEILSQNGMGDKLYVMYEIKNNIETDIDELNEEILKFIEKISNEKKIK